jgi:HSP20 family molecular chaperone IbpA
MGTAPARRENKGVAVPVITDKESACTEFENSLRLRVSRRAHQLFEQNGQEHGRDLAHWLQAESELISVIREVRDVGLWLTANLPVPDSTANSVSVLVRPDHALICAERPELPEDTGQDYSQSHFFYYVAKWPVEVDPSTSSAYIKDGILTLTAKRASSGLSTSGA